MQDQFQYYQVSPKDVVSSVAVQKAIGVGHDPQISKENPGKMILFVLSFLFYFICYEK